MYRVSLSPAEFLLSEVKHEEIRLEALRRLNQFYGFLAWCTRRDRGKRSQSTWMGESMCTSMLRSCKWRRGRRRLCCRSGEGGRLEGCMARSKGRMHCCGGYVGSGIVSTEYRWRFDARRQLTHWNCLLRERGKKRGYSRRKSRGWERLWVFGLRMRERYIRKKMRKRGWKDSETMSKERGDNIASWGLSGTKTRWGTNQCQFWASILCRADVGDSVHPFLVSEHVTCDVTCPQLARTCTDGLWTTIWLATPPSAGRSDTSGVVISTLAKEKMNNLFSFLIFDTYILTNFSISSLPPTSNPPML